MVMVLLLQIKEQSTWKGHLRYPVTSLTMCDRVLTCPT